MKTQNHTKSQYVKMLAMTRATIRVAAPLTGPRDFYGSMAQTAPEVQRNMIGQGDVETDGVR